MADSIWKKEITLGRKKGPKEPPAQAASDDAAAEASTEQQGTPFWKKEISLGGKKPRGEQKPVEQEQSAAPSEGGSTPFWKKEITVGRKKPPAQPAAAEPAVEATAGSEADGEAPPQPVPFWKKEINLGGGKKDASKQAREERGDEVPFWKRDVLGPKREKLNDPAGETSFWKKEVTLGRKGRDEVDRPAAEEAETAAPTAPEHHEPIKAAEAAAAALIADPNAEIEIFFQAPPRPDSGDAAGEEKAGAVPPAQPAAEPPAAEPPAAASAPSRSQPATAPPEPASQVPEPVAQTDVPGFEPLPEPPPLELPAQPAAARPSPQPPPPPPAAHAPAAPTAPPVEPADVAPAPPAPPAPSEPGPAPQVQPPVPAAELPPLPEDPKVPWWKKEISFSSKPKPQTIPTAVRTAQPPRQEGEQLPFWRKKIEIGRRPVDPDEVSIWKKEITFSRKSKQAADGDDGDSVVPKVSWWKQEIGGKKKAAEPAAASAEAPAAVASAVEPKVPWWKKEIGGKKKAAVPAGAAPAAAAAIGSAAEPKVPWWKKEIGGKKKAAAPAGAAPAQAAAAAAAGSAPEPKVPWWKKEIGGKKKAAAPAGAAAKEKKPKTGDGVPFWKKDLSLKTLKEVQLTLPTRSPGGKTEKAAKKRKASTKRLVGLKVGASQLAAARVVNNGVAEVAQVARRPLEAGIVVGGELRDPDALATQLKAFFTQNKLPKKGVRLGIASNRIGVRIFELGGIADDQQLDNAIQFRAQEALPIPLDEAVLDYHVIGEGVDAEGQPTKRILLVVAYRELVDRYVTACRKAGITLVGVDLEAFALLRALAPPRQEDEPAKAAIVGVAIGHDRSTFAVSDGRICEFTRVLEWGGAALNVAIARALDLAPSEVEGYKRSLILDGPAPVPEGLTQEQWGAAVDAVRRQLQSFARELVSSLQFYQNQPGSLGIGEIVIAGGTGHMPGLAEELQRLIGVPVRIGNPLARVKVAKKVAETEQIGSLAVAIGLGIED